jgi:chemotaxis response regulator CheB
MTGGVLRVLAADDDEDFRGSLEAALKAVAGIELVGSARDGLEAVRLFAALEPGAGAKGCLKKGPDAISLVPLLLALAPATTGTLRRGGTEQSA